MFPYTFSLGSHNYQVLLLVTRGLLPHVLESIHKIYLLFTHHLIVRGSKKQQRRGVGLFKFHKRRNFFSLLKTTGYISPCITLPCPVQKRPSSFLHFGQLENIHGTYLNKNFLICFSSLSPQSRKRMMNTLLLISTCM